MAQLTRRTCLTCGKRAVEVGPISWLGNCETCGQLRLAENVLGIHYKQGVAHKRRLRGIAKYLERELAGESQASG